MTAMHTFVSSKISQSKILRMGGFFCLRPLGNKSSASKLFSSASHSSGSEIIGSKQDPAGDLANAHGVSGETELLGESDGLAAAVLEQFGDFGFRHDQSIYQWYRPLQAGCRFQPVRFRSWPPGTKADRLEACPTLFRCPLYLWRGEIDSCEECLGSGRHPWDSTTKFWWPARAVLLAAR